MFDLRYCSSTDPPITNFSVVPVKVIALENGCPDSEPHNNFTLVCTAKKPIEVNPELQLTWMHNGTQQFGSVSSISEGHIKTNTLLVNTTTLDDHGTYTCTARIIIPSSPEVSRTGTSEIIVRGWCYNNGLILLCIIVKTI